MKSKAWVYTINLTNIQHREAWMQAFLHGKNQGNDIEISRERFLELKKSKEIIVETALFEDQWANVLNAYVDFELEHLQRAVRSTVIHHGTPDRFESANAINQRLMWLLSVARTFFDAGSRILKQVDSVAEVEFSQQRNEAYDDSLGYRVMEEVRNLMQHSTGFAIRSIQYANQWEQDESGAPTERFVNLGSFLDAAELRKFAKFKTSIRIELEGLEERLDVRLAAREYVNGMAKAYTNASDLMLQLRTEAISVTKEAIEMFHATTGESGFVRASNEDDSFSLWFENSERYQHLRSMNFRGSGALNRVFVSNRLPSSQLSFRDRPLTVDEEENQVARSEITTSLREIRKFLEEKLNTEISEMGKSAALCKRLAPSIVRSLAEIEGKEAKARSVTSLNQLKKLRSEVKKTCKIVMRDLRWYFNDCHDDKQQ